MPADQQESPGVQLANRIIDLANKETEAGATVEDIAVGLRHAAANFSAYAFFRSEVVPKDPNDTVENFIHFFEYYLNIHKPAEVASVGFQRLIDQAKNEL